MDIVKVNQELSLFQKSLIDGTRLGLISEGGRERLKIMGAMLVHNTAERFFHATAKQSSYKYAVRMVDVVLSFALYEHKSEDGVALLSNCSLDEVFKIGLSKLKEVDEIGAQYAAPTFPPAPRPSEEPNLFQQLAVEVANRQYNPSTSLHGLINKQEVHKEYKSLVLLAEQLVRMRHGARYWSAVEEEFGEPDDIYPLKGVEQCEYLINSHLFSTVFGLESGYRLSLETGKSAARMARPTLNEAREKLILHRVAITHDLREEYDRSVERFLAIKSVERFFRSRSTRVENLMVGEHAILYCWRIFGKD